MLTHKKLKSKTSQRPKDWLEFIETNYTRAVMPVGRRFQANIPEWNNTTNSETDGNSKGEDDTARWLGTRIWPIEARSTETGEEMIGRGRPDFCLCDVPGSVECVKNHVSAAHVKLQHSLSAAFFIWKFDEMGEEICELWSREEQTKFEYLVKRNPAIQGKSFIKSALNCFKSKTRSSIVSYYFNVYVPSHIGIKTRSGVIIVDSDDEAIGEESPKSKVCHKRSRSDTSPPTKAHYLTGMR
ncbi:hypothetical protein RJ641_032787 [Dillenia turbinata]|uniref:ELM2 domain-containing protein n=1 Tax=Dillenia turbinata TaxID=194707 RepID=A0AAN8VYG3_9MAGN